MTLFIIVDSRTSEDKMIIKILLIGRQKVILVSVPLKRDHDMRIHMCLIEEVLSWATRQRLEGKM
jgi:hypothetical protein